MSNSNSNKSKLGVDGIDPDVRAIYGAVAGEGVLRILSNDPFTMSKETGAAVRRDAFLAANKLIRMVLVISEPLDNAEDLAEQAELVDKLESVIEALGAFIIMSQNSGEGSDLNQSFAALGKIGEVADGTAAFAWSFSQDEQDNLSCGIRVVPVSDETEVN